MIYLLVRHILWRIKKQMDDVVVPAAGRRTHPHATFFAEPSKSSFVAYVHGNPTCIADVAFMRHEKQFWSEDAFRLPPRAEEIFVAALTEKSINNKTELMYYLIRSDHPGKQLPRALCRDGEPFVVSDVSCEYFTDNFVWSDKLISAEKLESEQYMRFLLSGMLQYLEAEKTADQIGM